MKIVGITGGIGSGKTTVAKMFEELGVPIYNSDIEAKALMNRSKVIKRKLIDLFGEKAYRDNILNRPYIAKIIFNNKELLEKMNGIVHPKVGLHFKRWLKKHNEKPYVLKESAILFETGEYKKCDFIILVTAPINDRINRVIKRDNSTQEKVQAIINNQSKDDDNKVKADFIINNLKLEDTQQQVLEIHEALLKSY
ncbi:dephospho-CoA kinase [Hanstruepera marina]|uniref:dephospho-CoA kinase n=1 Tax=Hanstruepera marina TaxID=2873265 RepID=UPI001CA646C8|nr:dephospho-CoA kinase [Hanstruepera marina]